MNKEMTAGKPGKMILNFTIPILSEIYSSSSTAWQIR